MIHDQTGIILSTLVLYGFATPFPREAGLRFAEPDSISVGTLYVYFEPTHCFGGSAMEEVGQRVVDRFREEVGISFQHVEVVPNSYEIGLKSDDFVMLVLDSDDVKYLGIPVTLGGRFGVGVGHSSSQFVYNDDIVEAFQRYLPVYFDKQVLGSQVGFVVGRLDVGDYACECNSDLLKAYFIRNLMHELAHAFGSPHLLTSLFHVSEDPYYIMAHIGLDSDSLQNGHGRFTPLEVEIMRYFTLNMDSATLEDRISLRYQLYGITEFVDY